MHDDSVCVVIEIYVYGIYIKEEEDSDATISLSANETDRPVTRCVYGPAITCFINYS